MFIHPHHGIAPPRKLETEFSQIFVSRTIRAFGASMVSLFIPIYLFQVSGGDFSVALPLITAVFTVIYGIRVLFTFQIVRLISKLGGKHVMTISAIIDAFAYLLLSGVSDRPSLIVPWSICAGFGSAAFFAALHLELCRSTGKEKAHKVGAVAIARKMAISLGPLVGGLVAGYYGFEYAAYIAAVVVLSSVIPLHTNSEPLRKTKPAEWLKVAELAYSDKAVRGNVGMGFNAIAAMLVWPLFIYIFLQSYQEVGIIISVSLLLALALMVAVGKNESKKSIEKEVKIGSSGSALTHLLRVFAMNPLLITVVNFLNDITFSVMVVPYIAQYYRNANRHGSAAYIAAMESAFALGALLMWVVILFVYMIIPDPRWAMFSGFALASFGVLNGRHILSK